MGNIITVNQHIPKKYDFTEIEHYDKFIIKYKKPTDTKYKPTTNTYKIPKELFKSFNNNFIYFRIMRISHRYKILSPEQATQFLKYNHGYYETIAENQIRKFYLDIDGKNEFSYNDLIQLSTDFLKYIEICYGYTQITYNIYLSYSNNIPTQDPDIKAFKSSHIIFNIGTNTHHEARQLLYNFLTQYKEIHQTDNYFYNSIDKTVYKTNQIMRQLNQSKKEYIKGEIIDCNKTLKRILIYPLTGKLTEEIKPNLTDLITVMDPNINIIKINTIELPDKDNNILADKTIKYYIYKNINTLTKILKSIDPIEFKETYKWKYNLYRVLYSLYYIDIIDYNDVMKSEIMELFLNKSNIEPFNTDCYREKNEEFIRKSINNKLFLNNIHFKKYTDLINPLPKEEVDFIKSIIDNNDNDIIHLKYNNIMNKHFFIINYKWSYNINYKVLLENYILYKEGKPTKLKIKCEIEHNFNLRLLKNQYNKHKEFLHDKTTEINDLNEIPITLNNSYYIKAPVGTGKTHIFMRKLLIKILTQTDNNILIIADIITLTHKQNQDVAEILKKSNLSPDLIYHYKDLLKDARNGKIKKNKKIFITTYDSYEKIKKYINFNHIIIDEFKNTLKRTIHIQDKNLTNNNKANKIHQLINDFNNCRSFYFLDADIDDEIYNFLKKNIIRPFFIYSLNNYKKPHNIRIIQENGGYEELIKCVNNNKNIVVATTSQKWGIKLFNKLANNENIKVVMIDKNGATHNISEKYENIELKNKLIINTELWKSYNVVIYTPTITTGISVNDMDYFYKTFIYCNKYSTDITQTSQFSYRVRNTQTNEIIIMIKNIHNTLNYKDKIELDDDTKQHKYLINENIDSYELFKSSQDHINTLELFNGLEKLGLNAGQKLMIKNYKNINDNEPYIELRNYENLKEIQQRDQFLFYYLLKNIEWGVKLQNIETHFFRPINNNIIQTKEEEPDTLTNKQIVIDILNDIINKIIEPEPEQKIINNNFNTLSLQYNDFINHKYLDDETYNNFYIKYGNQLDDTDECRDFIKTMKLKIYGISHFYYNKYKIQIANMLFIMEKDKIFYRALNIRYFYFRKALYFLIENLKIETDYTQELLKHKHNKTKSLFIKLYNLYIAFKILEILKINSIEDLKEIFKTDCYIDKTPELMNKLYNFLDDNRFKINYIKNTNRIRNKNNDKYNELSSVIKSVMNYIGINMTMRREHGRSKTDKKINIDTHNYRIQLLPDNEEDDKLYYNDITDIDFNYINNLKITRLKKAGYSINQYGKQLLDQPNYNILSTIINYIDMETVKDKINDYVDSENDDDT